MTEIAPVDLINAELERALFKRFWIWLGIVGSVVVAAVTAISILVSQVLVSTAKDAATKQIDELKSKLKDLEKTAMDSAIATSIAQAKSEAAAKASKDASTDAEQRSKQAVETIAKSQAAAAESQAAASNAAAKAKEAAGSFQELNDQLKSTSALLATENTKSLAESISKNSEFARIVSKSLAGTLEFTILKSDFIVQQATKSCPAGSQIVSASCIGNNGSLQAAVGPEFHLDGSVTCYRYGPTVMPVQATVICMTTK